MRYMPPSKLSTIFLHYCEGDQCIVDVIIRFHKSDIFALRIWAINNKIVSNIFSTKIVVERPMIPFLRYSLIAAFPIKPFWPRIPILQLVYPKHIQLPTCPSSMNLSSKSLASSSQNGGSRWPNFLISVNVYGCS